MAEALQSTDPEAALKADSAAPLKNFEKDLDFVLSAAGDAGLDLQATKSARAMVAYATSQGLSTMDWAGVTQLLQTSPGRLSCPGAFRESPTQAQPRVFEDISSLNASLPPPWHESESELLLRASVLNARRGSPLVVVDDDPTGTQSVHSIPAFADWSSEQLRAAMAEEHPCFYVLSNTRALSEAQAVERAETIASNICTASHGRPVSIVSRGDSTLRGHFPAETDALARGLGWQGHSVLLAPFFKEGGRLTAYDMHYVASPDGSIVPASDTEFAKDRAFGFSSSYMPDWVAEKTQGNVSSAAVISLSLDMIRLGSCCECMLVGHESSRFLLRMRAC